MENDRVPLKEVRFVSIDILNQDYIVASFSNGEAVRISTDKLKRLILMNADRIVKGSD